MTTKEIIKEYKRLDNQIEEMYVLLSNYKKENKNYSTLKIAIRILERKYKKIDKWIDAMEEGNGYQFA